MISRFAVQQLAHVDDEAEHILEWIAEIEIKLRVGVWQVDRRHRDHHLQRRLPFAAIAQQAFGPLPSSTAMLSVKGAEVPAFDLGDAAHPLPGGVAASRELDAHRPLDRIGFLEFDAARHLAFDAQPLVPRRKVTSMNSFTTSPFVGHPLRGASGA